MDQNSFGHCALQCPNNVYYSKSSTILEAVKGLKKAFNENDITITLPIKTLDFRIKGGIRLNEELNQTNKALSLQTFG